MIHLSTLISHYKRRDIQEALVHYAEGKEIAVSYGGSGYGKRPDSLLYPADVLAAVQRGASSFHCSEELWKNPLQIETGMKKNDIEDLRNGWDLVLDIDCPVLYYSQIAGQILIDAICYHDIEHVTVKFSGNHGFHITVPFECFPESVHGIPIERLFPEGPRRIAAYLQEFIRAQLSQKLLEHASLGTIAASLLKKPIELMQDARFDPFQVLKIDTVLIAPRHLYRMPYSFNEKSGLVSIPIARDKIIEFDKKTAQYEQVVVGEHPFQKREGIIRGEATRLLLNALDYKLPAEKEVTFETKTFDTPSEAVPAICFPPCINHIFSGLKDGKKRAMFILINFLSSAGWSNDQIEQYLKQWNEKNPEPLRENLLIGQLRQHSKTRKTVLPPNCDNKAYYQDLGICHPDGLCTKIRNPLNYALIRTRMRAQEKMMHEREPREKELRGKKIEEKEKREKETGENSEQQNIIPKIPRKKKKTAQMPEIEGGSQPEPKIETTTEPSH